MLISLQTRLRELQLVKERLFNRSDTAGDALNAMSKRLSVKSAGNWPNMVATNFGHSLVSLSLTYPCKIPSSER